MLECLNCEKLFQHNEIVSIDPSFCSLECEEEFQAILKEGQKESIKRGLSTPEGEPLPNGKQSELLNTISKHFENMRTK